MYDPAYVIPEPPPGEVRTLVNPPSSGRGVIPVAIIATAIAFVVVCLRIYTRLAFTRKLLGVDDVLVVISMLISIAFCGFSVHLANLGCGLHGWDMLLSTFSPPYLLTTMCITLTYCTTISFAKLSILFFYLRLSPERCFRIAVYGLICLTITYTITYIIVILNVCRPVAANWDLSLSKYGECFSKLIPMMTLSVANIVIDFAILLIPIHVVIPLQMPRRQKLSLILLFATGGFVCAAAIYRTYILPSLINSDDYTWDNPPQQIWGSIEVNAGLLCASIPALKPFFTRHLPFLISSRFRSNDRSEGSVLDVLATKVQRNRQRQMEKSYELSERDSSVPGHSLTAIDQTSDDETRLWSNSGQTITGGRQSGSTEIVTNKNQSHWSKTGPGPEIEVTGNGGVSVSNKDRSEIIVTKETKVTYGKP